MPPLIDLNFFPINLFETMASKGEAPSRSHVPRYGGIAVSRARYRKKHERVKEEGKDLTGDNKRCRPCKKDLGGLVALVKHIQTEHSSICVYDSE